MQKFPHDCWDLKPQPLGYDDSALPTALTLQVKVKDVKVYALQSMSNHLQGGNLH